MSSMYQLPYAKQILKRISAQLFDHNVIGSLACIDTVRNNYLRLVIVQLQK